MQGQRKVKSARTNDMSEELFDPHSNPYHAWGGVVFLKPFLGFLDQVLYSYVNILDQFGWIPNEVQSQEHRIELTQDL